MRRMCLAAALIGACTSEPPPMCTPTEVDLGCSPGYVPTFDNVYANTLKQDCGSSKGACHSAKGDGNMSLVDPGTAYNALLDGRVTPGDPSCSELIVRTQGIGKDYQMPKGSALSAAERCALVKWVAAGAPGPGEPLPMMGASP